ncbi:MAG: MerR family DNA-binding transcriptional regulator [Propionibacteriaceae bacterium]|jgi:hypothetical protein|nr:MerR family DNA-binding transcriptional regulator [Propionibacteriaceae bacterium]
MRFAVYGTKDVCKLGHVTPRTLRHYHKIGLLPETERTASGYRVCVVPRNGTQDRNEKQYIFIFVISA